MERYETWQQFGIYWIRHQELYGSLVYKHGQWIVGDEARMVLELSQ